MAPLAFDVGDLIPSCIVLPNTEAYGNTWAGAKACASDARSAAPHGLLLKLPSQHPE